MISDIVARSSGFSPRDLADLALWLDSYDSSTFILDNSSRVIQWLDKSGNGRHAIQSVENNRPIKSDSVIFDGINDHLLITTNVLVANTTHGVFWVFRRLGAGTGDAYRPSLGGILPSISGRDIGAFHYVKTNNLGASYPFVLTGSIEGGIPNYENAGPAYVSNRGYVMAFQNNLSGFGVWRDGTLEGTTSALRTPSNVNNGIVLGAQFNVTRYSNIALSEVILLERSDTTSRQLIEGYLARKWNLVNNLPSDHPYK